ncbi:N-acetylmuramoyl-L-alanine amidase-like domain-containing protein [Bacteroides coprosuis]|uniref:N-acetylmuramoyl-L-alanine amidase-like domain-containing protein n=1 Tax=Bacteroides coprosuis TaxID=151276 RepID=UPI001D3FDA4E|nr:N-acetylmuramoyl-L-alanine amidase-like domain-containing protein [Bacteroides coprosuis]HJD91315.1 DUF1460 domain-containing protein [Bacteroides coprosuis]
MKKVFFFFFSILFFLSSNAQENQNLIIKNALQYIGTPYRAHTLEFGHQEKLVVNKKAVDCTTFVEYVLAQSLAQLDSINKQSEKTFLQKIRYRDGIINGYTSRLHYFSEWIQEGEKNKFITDITALEATDSMYIALSYMSTHPQYYKHLSNSSQNREEIAEVEKSISGTIIKWLPEQKLPTEGLPWIKNGDIIALTVGIYGLDVSHVGFAIYQGGQLHLLHASSAKGKVIIEPIPLSTMLQRNKNWTGIRVLRPNVYLDQKEYTKTEALIESKDSTENKIDSLKILTE